MDGTSAWNGTRPGPADQFLGETREGRKERRGGGGGMDG